MPNADMDKVKLPQVLKSLSDPIRLTIVATLFKKGPNCSCSVFNYLGKKSNLSQHYRNLRLNGLISIKRSGIHSYLTLRKKEIDQKFPGLLVSIINSWQKNNYK
ncbi:transcriptional regulator [Lactobacillus acetotolerans]|jgi:DNA-binding transcriptional ArsR family regulator|uniref:Transcriptional regulator n=1 Tax=Lactobacillus acetotolerans TaxID=1600 RepID=A0A0D6A0T9_9LACO|nr:helix-turn-helix transcriptional regulator [Lactobacillus acetotolerans]MBN7277152.1 ArsR family transcriptional regulator [Lactobacillus acetotolerans]BAQ56437.1 transcriptional regulator [Lactobacillus acetotolerans]